MNMNIYRTKERSTKILILDLSSLEFFDNSSNNLDPPLFCLLFAMLELCFPENSLIFGLEIDL